MIYYTINIEGCAEVEEIFGGNKGVKEKDN